MFPDNLKVLLLFGCFDSIGDIFYMKAIIPTGGRGTRMQPLTFSTNKHFIPVGNKPLIFYPIEAVANSGIKDVAITYNPGWLEIVKSYLGDGSKWGLKFTYIMQEKPLGLANIFQVCEKFVEGRNFLMHLGDNIFTSGITDLVSKFSENKLDGMVAMVEHPENTRMGVPYFDSKGNLIKYVEKPNNPPHKFAIPGLYFFSSAIYKCFSGKDRIKPSARGEYEIDAPYQWLIDHKYKVQVFKYDSKWLDPGKFDDWIYANQYLLDKNVAGINLSKVNGTNQIENRVDIGRRCRINNSKIRGPVSIGDGVEITNSYIGPFTSISNDCIINSSHVENSVLMHGVVIKSIKQPINESLIGSQAQVLDEDGPTDWLQLFIGEKSIVKV